MDLKQLRDGIDNVDSEILSLFMKRMELCRGVADYKKEHNMPVFQGGREQQIIDRIVELTNDKNLEKGTSALFTTIMDISKILQNRTILAENRNYKYTAPDFAGAKKIGCQGTSGANSEAAAKKVFGDREFTFYPSFEEVFKAVQSGEADYGVLPVQNSTAGSVDSTYDLMANYPFYIVKMVTLEINHCLAAKKGTKLEDITCVYSHRQALSQCEVFLSKTGLKKHEYSNTATAAEKVLNSSEPIAAICSVDCAEKLGLEIIEKNIADCTINRTQFIVIAKDMQVAEDSDAVSVMLTIPHKEGSLYRLLTKFYVNNMNLLRIESRPIRDGSFNVMFFLDFSGKMTDPNVEAVLRDLEENLDFFRCIGTFKNETFS
ncbi:bifunctional chorismate mutase/prephenate dehydratase [Ruminococcus flavefaciens]|uniref:Bifunctional chorismate mutase/prephenate dehydratase n=1 Tax=Ruminococcus flavefaciens TaxID=1265 RepID=A0A1M7GLH0_RUMFL|nr:bifunctional chorismate mutase/prephenate dehydratase [Ruminococcus flavefaciens]SHM16978.1 chorismate mutase [Ruminococcus flavefaciens]